MNTPSDIAAQDNIQNLNVSDRWKRKFHNFQKIECDRYGLFGNPNNVEFKKLSSSDRAMLHVNVFALLFGVFYYLFKGMWVKGAFIFGVLFTLFAFVGAIFAAIGAAAPLWVMFLTYILSCGAYMAMANYDYYRKMVFGEVIWKGFPSILTRPLGIAGWLVASVIVVPFLLYFVALLINPAANYYLQGQQNTTNQNETLEKQYLLEAFSGVWRIHSGQFPGVVEVNLKSEPRTISVRGMSSFITITEVDLQRNAVTFNVHLTEFESIAFAGGQRYVTWTLSKKRLQENRFFLVLIDHEGMALKLDFIRSVQSNPLSHPSQQPAQQTIQNPVDEASEAKQRAHILAGMSGVWQATWRAPSGLVITDEKKISLDTAPRTIYVNGVRSTVRLKSIDTKNYRVVIAFTLSESEGGGEVDVTLQQVEGGLNVTNHLGETITLRFVRPL